MRGGDRRSNQVASRELQFDGAQTNDLSMRIDGFQACHVEPLLTGSSHTCNFVSRPQMLRSMLSVTDSDYAQVLYKLLRFLPFANEICKGGVYYVQAVCLQVEAS